MMGVFFISLILSAKNAENIHGDSKPEQVAINFGWTLTVSFSYGDRFSRRALTNRSVQKWHLESQITVYILT